MFERGIVPIKKGIPTDFSKLFEERYEGLGIGPLKGEVKG